MFWILGLVEMFKGATRYEHPLFLSCKVALMELVCQDASPIGFSDSFRFRAPKLRCMDFAYSMFHLLAINYFSGYYL